MTTSTAAQTTEASNTDAHLKHEPPKRNKTWGEHVFNWRTYGGIALLGNEAASLAIVETVPKMGPTKKLYADGLEWFKKLGEKYSAIPRYVKEGELQGLMLAVVGGMLMVPFVKYAEDHKGEQVRKLDRKHYGARSDTDPKLIEAHKEMDEAPKQTWSSLWKGRLLTVGAAIAVDSTMGWKDAPSHKLFKNPTYQKFGSMQRIANETAAGVTRLLNKEWMPKALHVEGSSKQLTEKLVGRATWLLVLSSTLTLLFYASSKLFAKKSEEKVERKQELLAARAHGLHADGTEEGLEAVSAEQAEAKPAAETPTLQVKNIRREDMVTSVPQLSQGA